MLFLTTEHTEQDRNTDKIKTHRPYHAFSDTVFSLSELFRNSFPLGIKRLDLLFGFGVFVGDLF